MSSTQKTAPPVYMMFLGLVYIALVAGFVWITVSYGGEALGGRIADGHYYLVNKRHITEVSATVFENIRNYEIFCIGYTIFFGIMAKNSR